MPLQEPGILQRMNWSDPYILLLDPLCNHWDDVYSIDLWDRYLMQETHTHLDRFCCSSESLD